MSDIAGYKKAAIDWVLANGTSNGMCHSTRSALADLSVRGVDYDDSDLPDFRMVATDGGDSFTDATHTEAFAATVYPLDRDKANWREGYTFHVGDDDIKRILMTQVILGVLAAATDGDAVWKAKVDENEVARIEKNRAADAEWKRQQAEASAVKAAATADKIRKVAAQEDFEKGLI